MISAVVIVSIYNYAEYTKRLVTRVVETELEARLLKAGRYRNLLLLVLSSA